MGRWVGLVLLMVFCVVGVEGGVIDRGSCDGESGGMVRGEGMGTGWRGWLSDVGAGGRMVLRWERVVG